MPDAKVALVIGAGDATGGAIARRFAREGFTACVTRRNADKLAPLVARIESEGGKARAFGSDARKEEQMVALIDTIEREVGAIEVAAFNIGANVRFPIRETTARVYFKVWEMACFAGFLMGREVAKVWCRAAAAPSCSPAPPPACAAAPASPPSPAPSTRCARWRRAWRASWGRRASTWRTW